MTRCAEPIRAMRAHLSLLLASILLGGCAALPQRAPETPEPAAEPLPEAALADDDVDARFEAALRLMRSRRYPQAREAFGALTETSPALPGPWLNLGILQAQDGDLEAAAQSLRNALDAAPDLLAAHNWLGEVERRRGDAAAARRAYEAALAIDAGYAAAHLNLGLLHERELREPRRAIEHYRRYYLLGGKQDLRVLPWIAELEAQFPAHDEETLP